MAGYEACIAHDVFIHHTGGQGRTGDALDYPRLIAEAWEVYRAKWDLPADLTHVTYADDTGRYVPTRPFAPAVDYIRLPNASSVEALVTRRT